MIVILMPVHSTMPVNLWKGITVP